MSVPESEIRTHPSTPYHFAKRCHERGVADGPFDGLYWKIRSAIERGGTDDVELVKTIQGTGFWRFFSDGCPFYAVVKPGDNSPVTVMDHGMYRNKRWSEKQFRRGSKFKNLSRARRSV